MAMILDAFMSKFSTLLSDFVHEEVIMLLGVKDELQMLRRRMRSIQYDVWGADVWVGLFVVPLYNSNGSFRILITTKDENVANGKRTFIL
ncbi:hypothetical protein IEQ34_001140 [Dendrobium chrysotoxum]|uniref:Uncharacterized protein n=1 Tax=Dendrobium chrysotoxum TaxID=161865 RepID=A0AAV7HMG8_DENCH|nr:hypothetical protein IEQ34_001140 [Dendrobium chrysotoxum]